jgi:putative transposase
MTHATDDSAISMALEQIIKNGFEGLDTAVSILINEAMRIERSRALEAEPWQRTQTRKGYANAYKPKNVESRIGKLALQIPQVRGPLQFYPNALEKGLRSERALKLAMAARYPLYCTYSLTRDILKI